MVSRSRFVDAMEAAAFLVAVVALVPLGFIAAAFVQTGWSAAGALIFRPRVGELLVNTVLLVVLSLPPAALLALSLAWLTERSDLPLARLAAWIAIAPLAVPAFVQSYAWVTLVPGIHGLGAGVGISILAYFPFLYLPLAATLRRLDPALEDAAASLGHSPSRVFLRVVLPQLRLALLGGALLVALHLLAEYGLYAMIRFDTFTTAIMDQFQSAYSGPAASMLAAVLVLLCAVLLAAEAGLRGRHRYARLGPGSARPPVRRELGRWRYPLLLLPALTAALSIGVPAVTLARWLVAGGAGIWHLDRIGLALVQTLQLAALGGVAATLAAMPMAWLSVRAPGRRQKLLEAANYVVGALPGVIVALAFVTVAIRVLLPFYQTLATVAAAYMVMFLPRSLLGLRASLAQAPAELEQAAASLGVPPLRVVARVTARLAAPGIAASFALVALGIANELPATQMLAPNGTRTLAMAFWALSGEIDYAAAAPYALLMIVLSVPLTLLLHRSARGGRG